MPKPRPSSTSAKTGSAPPKVAILIATYNRSGLLRRAIESVLKQDFEDWRLDVVDDASTDDTQDVMRTYDDSRIAYVRNPQNVGGLHGDIAILQAFVRRCDAEHCIYLCDDDYWIPSDLLSRQVEAMDAHPGLAFVQGGMAQEFDQPVGLMTPNLEGLVYSAFDADRRQTFAWHLFPSGVMQSREYLTLFASDPANRNIVAGATLFRTAALRQAGALDRAVQAGVRWQAGYALSCGTATQGPVLYLNEPCVMVKVDTRSASFRGGQRPHLLDALSSIEAAAVPEDIRRILAWSVLRIYVSNKIGHGLGWFRENAAGDISAQFLPPISAAEFLDIAGRYRIPLNEPRREAIRASDGLLTKDAWGALQTMLA